jgi:hypothetical protein
VLRWYPNSRDQVTATAFSFSVTSIVPLIGVLTKPIFAESVKINIDPCQLFSFTTNRRGSPGSACNIWLNERSTDAIMSAFGRLCEIVIRILDPLEPMRTLCYSQLTANSEVFPQQAIESGSFCHTYRGIQLQRPSVLLLVQSEQVMLVA